MAEVIIAQNQEQASSIAAEHIAQKIVNKPDFVLGLATGSTPLALYKQLTQIIQERQIDVSHVQGFALDEYVGLPKDHPESYFSVIRKEVVDPMGLNPDLIHTPSGDFGTVETAGEYYETQIKIAGGVDLQILGVGQDGHIGFNEPGSSLASRTRIKTLTQKTRQDNARFFDSIDQVPHHCVTQGIGTILEARHLVLLAFGETKADAIAGCVEGSISSSNPASALQLHPHATVLLDQAAASKLQHKDYYQYAFENKPSWQGI
ncbi:MAG: glucosamine-6-phosphate deaminase [Bifidobacteriaceae bacterium]|jgi:glucosamine-6-phosphate deaminase|nr:glucosamine-6-phosphate deaminase [Bifidobacteriaceae bacterium]